MRCSTKTFAALLSTTVLLVAACADSPTTAVETETMRSSVVELEAANAAESARRLAICPTRHERSASAVIQPHVGGTVSVDGGSITLPPGAVSEPTLITVTVPRSRHLVLDIRANEQEHFEFDRAATVTIDYSRCPPPVGRDGLTVWVVDSGSWTMLEDLGGDDDGDSRSITAETMHLSELTIAT